MKSQPNFIHSINPNVVYKYGALTIDVIGCGGTGSFITSNLYFLHQALIAHGREGGINVTLHDGDIVTETNCARQVFTQAETGHNKAITLIRRLNAFWNLNWQANPNYVDENTRLKGSIVISCVDTRKARKQISEAIHESRNAYYWLDIGNNESNGQFILGQPKIPGRRRSAERLRTATELFPLEVANEEQDKTDRRPSCSAIEALTEQEPFINATLAGQALAMLTTLLIHGEISYHGGFYNMKTGVLAPIRPNKKLWKTMSMRKIAT
jgi:PRTRC genetic system ThiF family protein